MNSATTPGPWHAHDRGIGWEIHAGAQPSVEPDCFDAVLNGGYRDTFTEADARMAAAAPELFEALRELLEVYELVLKFRGGHAIAREEIAMDMARAAIKKADGKP